VSAESRRACDGVLRLREAEGTAQRSDVLDAEIREAEATLAGLPAIAVGDPQTEAAARLVTWASAGVITSSRSTSPWRGWPG